MFLGLNESRARVGFVLQTGQEGWCGGDTAM